MYVRGSTGGLVRRGTVAAVATVADIGHAGVLLLLPLLPPSSLPSAISNPFSLRKDS